MKNIIAMVLFYCVALNANAALITEFWRSTVTSTYNISGLVEDDTFDWSLTFNDDGDRYSIYNADDVPIQTLCIATSPSLVGCDSLLGSSSVTYFYLSDAAYDFNGLFDEISGSDFVDTRDSPAGRQRLAGNFNDGANMRISRIFVDSNVVFSLNQYASGQDFGVINLYGINGNDLNEQAIVLFASELLRTATVPAPATLALMGLGIAGLGWSRRRKA